MLPTTVAKLIEELCKLPTVGPKTAERLTFYLLKKPDFEIKNLGEAVLDLRKNLTFCKRCFCIAEADLCKLCDSPSREQSLLCVVEEILDLIAIEKTGQFKGIYHVLHGALSPLDGIGPEEIRAEELARRLEKEKGIKEVILATNPTLEGEATAMYLSRLIKPFGVKITRIARGMPQGGDLEYADEVTLGNALKGRVEW
ncbi:recombination protein RecR [Candidatus Peregrinibacteria bacterium CG08_land_8_20_14_0_20_41_10]|nr:MAG: recombination protein RecR [Candidatus Peregrinibacteria bacterium CG08_land_8_20_14_0_20_41_10]